MEYVYWVLDQQLAGRPGPKLRPWDLEALYAGNIRTIISLPTDVVVEDLSAHGFTHYRAEFPPILLHSAGMQKAFIHQALPVWTFIDEQLKNNRPTLVHCYEGNDRTGVILAGYLVVYCGLTPEQAIQKLLSVNPKALRAGGYKEAVRHLQPYLLPNPRTLL